MVLPSKTLGGVLLAAVLVFGGCDGAPAGPAPPEETRVAVPALRQALEASLRGLEVHLNNYGPEGAEREHSWHRADDAYLRLPPALGGSVFRFDLPESRSVAGPFRLLYYVNDLNVRADGVAVEALPDTAAGLLRVFLPFEEEGKEFKGHCLSRTFLGTRGCLGSKDRIAPDIELAAAGVALTLRPEVFEGGLTLAAEAVVLRGTVQAGGVCKLDLGVASFDICDTLADYEADLRAQVEQRVGAALVEGEVQAEIATALRPLLDALGIGTVVYVEREGAALVIGHTP